MNKFLNQLGSEKALAREVNEIRLKSKPSSSSIWLQTMTQVRSG